MYIRLVGTVLQSGEQDNEFTNYRRDWMYCRNRKLIAYIDDAFERMISLRVRCNTASNV